MAIELAADDITANAVAPGPTETDSFRANSPKGSEGEARYLARVPMGRLALTHEVAASITFLLRTRRASLPIRRYSSMVAQASGVYGERLMHSRKMKVEGL